MGSILRCGLLNSLCFLLSFPSLTQERDGDIRKKPGEFDRYMEQTRKDWNTPGAGVGIVVKNSLVFAKGYGYRDYEKNFPLPQPRCIKSPPTRNSSLQ